ncbi:MAG: flavodoxin family protein [Candidatus Moduliflexus flocculans]|nr:flavodoxin family protein [Candidatus Moduliflexus flocculans]
MPKALVSYYSRTGNTKKMAARIAEVLESQGLEVDLKKVEDTAPADLLGYDCIVLGSPTYYGTMAWELKKLLDESVKYPRQAPGEGRRGFHLLGQHRRRQRDDGPRYPPGAPHSRHGRPAGTTGSTTTARSRSAGPTRDRSTAANPTPRAWPT